VHAVHIVPDGEGAEHAAAPRRVHIQPHGPDPRG